MPSTKILEGLVFEVMGFPIYASIVTTWIIMLALVFISLISQRHFSNRSGSYQAGLEGIIAAIKDMIEGMLPGKVEMVFPFITTLWVLIFFSNLIGLIPGFSSPTADLPVTSALALIVFLSVHWFGVRSVGFKRYLKHYLSPNPIMMPFHLISELSRTLALAIRLFGNVMSLEIAAALIMMVAGFLVPVPLLILHIVEAVIQTYLFGMLALIYIAGGVQSQQNQLNKERNNDE